MERIDAAGHGADPARRGAGPRDGEAGGGAGRRGDRDPVPALLPQSGPRAARQGDHREANSPACSSPPRTSCSQEYREYERTSTAAANAYIGPRVRTYLTEMEQHLDEAGFGGNFLIVQSTGGLFDVDDARQSCIRMLESGPAAGVVGTKALCDSIGIEERHRVRHGRHHRQGRRDRGGQRADDRRRADRRLRHRACRCRCR